MQLIVEQLNEKVVLKEIHHPHEHENTLKSKNEPCVEKVSHESAWIVLKEALLVEPESYKTGIIIASKCKDTLFSLFNITSLNRYTRFPIGLRKARIRLLIILKLCSWQLCLHYFFL